MVDVLFYAGCAILAFYTQLHYSPHFARIVGHNGHFLLPLRYQIAVLWGVLLFYPTFSFFGAYKFLRGKSFGAYLRVLFAAFVTLILLLAASGFIAKAGEYYSRQWFLLWQLYAILVIVLGRVALWCLLYMVRKRGLNAKQIVIIGSGRLVENLVAAVKNALWSGFAVTAIFDGHLGAAEVLGVKMQPIPDDISDYIRQHKVEEIWLALSSWDKEEVDALMQKLSGDVITLRYFPGVVGVNLFDYSISEVLGFPVINIIASPMTGSNRLVKAIEDRVLSLIILLLISPLMLLIALLVKLSSPGPIFYKQLRHGWDGKPIYIYKFRTMHMHKEECGVITQATADDPRITAVGKLLRRVSFDELPQFINVLQGRMSIVGPRPHAVEHNEYYKNLITSYMLRHHVKPGVTGWAQVQGWRGETDTLEKMQKRVECDLYYINHWSLWFDVKIIFLTILRGFAGKNAY